MSYAPINLTKKTAFSCAFIYSLLITSAAFGQWEPDIQLTNIQEESRTSKNNACCIAANGNMLHAVWIDFRYGFFRKHNMRTTVNEKTGDQLQE